MTERLTDRLEEILITQCVSEGWLDKSAAKSLKQHLRTIRTAVQNNQRTEIRQAIETFKTALEEMASTESDDPDQEPSLTQEALMLLGANAAYLLTRFNKMQVAVEPYVQILSLEAESLDDSD